MKELFEKIKIKIKNLFFEGTIDYWDNRYKSGGNSGAGSYGILAEFKAEIINDFLEKHNIYSIIEFGCGDGNQLKLINYNMYIGLDVSKYAIEKCINIFENDELKSFYLYNPYCFLDNQRIFSADITISLDVIYHLVEEDIFNLYMKHLFTSSKKFVLIYSSDVEMQHNTHERRRKFTKWIKENITDYELVEYIPNKYPEFSLANFYIYKKID